jgi:cytochrome c
MPDTATMSATPSEPGADPEAAAPAPTGMQGTPEQNGGSSEPSAGAVPLDQSGEAPQDMAPASPDPEAAAPAEPTDPPRLENVLVFSRTAGFRHESIPTGIAAIRTLGAQNGFAVDATEDPTRFNDEALAGFDVIVFLSTTQDVLDDAQQAALERFIRAGGGWVGVHAAADTEYAWPWYGQLLGGGAFFRGHPAIQTVTVIVEDAEHASTEQLPATFQVEDELYSFQVNPRPSVNVLLRLDESTYSVGEFAMGADHPIAWYHEFDGGRAWYTGLGHTDAMYADPRFTQHLLGGIRWAAHAVP